MTSVSSVGAAAFQTSMTKQLNVVDQVTFPETEGLKRSTRPTSLIWDLTCGNIKFKPLHPLDSLAWCSCISIDWFVFLICWMLPEKTFLVSFFSVFVSIFLAFPLYIYFTIELKHNLNLWTITATLFILCSLNHLIIIARATSGCHQQLSICVNRAFVIW